MTQEFFLEEAFKGKNIFLTGKGGTGKSFIVKDFIQRQRKHNKKVVVVAPTGIAAINCGGATIHKTFSLYGEEYLYIKKQKIKWSEIDILVIDEISMVSGFLLDYIDKVLRKYSDPNLPFGGIQVICVGDLKQLPPIVSPPLLEKMENKYGSEFFNVSNAYKNGGFIEIELSDIKRTNDQLLIDLLNGIREGELDISKFKSLKSLAKEDQKIVYDNSVCLMAYNKNVDHYNNIKLNSIKGEEYVFNGSIIRDFNMNNVNTPEVLKLKIGAKIMVTKNLGTTLVNGDLGEVIKIDGANVTIFVNRLKQEVTISYAQWDNIEFTENGEQNILGSFIQIPLRLSWALTIHKVQGLTLDNIIYYYEDSLSLQHSYVAISRGTSYEGIYIN